MRDNRRSLGWLRDARGHKPHLRLVVGLPFVTGLLSFGIGVYAYQAGRTDAAVLLSNARERALVLAVVPASAWWLLAMTALGTLIGLAIALAFTRQLKILTRHTAFLARRNFSFPVELEADGEVAPLVSAINDLLRSVREYAHHSVADGMISLSRAGDIQSINPRAAVALGVDAGAVIGSSFRQLIPDVPANRDLIEALVCALERSEPFDLEQITWVNTRGQHLRVDLKGTVLAGEESIISVLIVFGEALEMERVQREVNRAHRLLVIGGFAAELAHEIRNPLSSVLGLVGLLHARLPVADEGHRHLEVLERAANRIDRLVGQLLDLVPTEMQDLERRDPVALVRETVEFVRLGELERAGIELVERYDEKLPACVIDADRIARAVENLVRNAYAHTPDGGTITVTTRSGAEGEIEIEVANTGSYVRPEDRDRIFQPFVSGRANGTGLGLAISRQIAYAHGGSLEVESVESSHTAFILRLPVAEDTVLSAPLPVPSQPSMAAGVA